MRLRCLVFAAAAPLLPPSTLSLTAQQPVRVLRHSPAAIARPGDAITISFDRPVVGSLERTPDPNRIVRIEPSLDARVQWRDPTTLRVLPRTPFVPGTRYRITLSNDFTAMDGGRLEQPYQFAITTAGPALLASVPPLHATSARTLVPNGSVQLVYSAVIETANLGQVVRVELKGDGVDCDRRTIPYTVRSQRPIRDTDDWHIKGAGGWERDSLEQSFRRVIEMRPIAPLPDGCAGAIVLPSLDPADRAEIRYPIATSPRFAMVGVHCVSEDCAAGEHLRVAFTVPVFRDSLAKHLRLDPPVAFEMPSSDAAQQTWTIKLRLMPRTAYRARVDTTLTDVYGRRIAGTRDATVTTRDRNSALGHQLGFFTVSRARPVLRLTHVNVDSVELVIVPIPDSIRATVLVASGDADSVARMVGRLRDTVRYRIAMSTPFNTERITELPIPLHVLRTSTGSLFAIRAAGIARASPIPTNIVRRRGELQPIEIVGSLHEPSRRTAIVQFTDLIAHAKVSDDGGSVLVTDANRGQPVAGARVTTRDARDRIIAVGETNAAGVATLVSIGPRDSSERATRSPDRYARYWGPRGDTRLVEVVRATDRSLTPMGGWDWMRAEGVERLGGSHYEAKLVHTSLFTDRGIYRPGETIYLTSILRRGPLGGLRVPDPGDSVRVRVTVAQPDQAEPRTVRDTVLRLNEFGTAADSFPIGGQMPLGSYEVHVDAYARGWQPAGSESFQLAEYRAPEFETKLAVDSAVRFLGDTLTARASAQYYFGAPMGGAVVRWSAVTVDAAEGVIIAGLPRGFVVGTSYNGGTPRAGRADYANGVDTLDASGSVALRVPTSGGADPAPARVELTAAVDDLNRQSVSARQSVLMHASSLYIAARDSSADSWYWTEGRPRRFDLLTVRPDGERVSGVRIRVAAVRHGMRFVYQGEGTMPEARWMTDTIHRDSMVTREATARYAYTPRSPAWHELIFSATDDRGRSVRTSVGGYVLGRTWAAWTDNPLRLAMRLDADSIAPGDSLAVRFVSPFQRAEAWVTVEREAVLAQRRLTVRAGESTVRIPVTDVFVPGAQVSVLLVNAGATWGTDSTHNRFRAGYAPLSVSRSTKALAVDVRPAKSQYVPGDSARITVSVRDHRSKPVTAHVTLWAVDEGVLALAYYQRPNPLDAIHSAYGTSLSFGSTATTVASLRRFLTPPGWVVRGHAALNSMTVGSAAASGAITVNTGTLLRTDFRTTAFYVASLIADTNGTATTTVKLPDNLTTYRIFAVAVTAGDAYGSGESTITLTKPLVARASLPRFLRTGDSMFAGAVINNNTSSSVVATVRAAATHVVRTGDTAAVRTLEANRGSETRFHWRVDALPGESAAFRFDVDGGANSDALETPLPIRPAYAPRYHAVAGVVRGQSTVRMLLPKGIDPSRSRLTLRVGTSPAPIVQAAYAQVDVYPYMCSEQLSSTGQVILSVLRLQRAGLLDSTAAPDARTLRRRLQFVVDELARRQSYFGGIGYWVSNTWTSRWLSAYAGTLIVDARDAGARVDSAVIAKLVGFVQFEPDTTSVIPGVEYGTRRERQRIVAWNIAQDLAVLHFLRRAGAADLEREAGMRNVTSQMVWEDRVWLAELLAGWPDQTAARAELARVWRDVEVAGTRIAIPDSLLQTLGFRSHVRPVARLLRATLAVDPDHPRLAALMERVVQQARAEQGRWWNTQDFAAMSSALVDLAALRTRAGSSSKVTVRSARGGATHRVLLTAIGAGQADSSVALDGLLEPDGEWLALPVQIESEGSPAFYALTVDEVPLATPAAPDAKGIVVERWFERFDNGKTVTEVTEGDLVRGRLRITVPSDREYVAVEDMLPAGLEVVDLSLRTSSLGPFESEGSREAEGAGNQANAGGSSLPWLYGSWAGGWWSPWEHEEKRDDRVMYFARVLWKGTYTASYVARATTAGTFVRPPAHAEEMYNRSVSGRSEGGTFRVLPKQ